MKTAALIKSKTKFTKAKYVALRTSVIHDITLNANNIYPDDLEMRLGVRRLCNHLYEAEFNEVSADLVRGLAGFIKWSVQNFTKISGGTMLTNLIHDLGEFRNNKDAEWFSPRTESYAKFL